MKMLFVIMEALAKSVMKKWTVTPIKFDDKDLNVATGQPAEKTPDAANRQFVGFKVERKF